MNLRALAVVMAVSVAGASLAAAQSLAELARKEKERRAQLGRKGKSFDDRDLAGLPTGAEVAEPSSAGSQASSAAGGIPAEAPPAEVDPSTTETYWRERSGAIETRIAQIEAKLAEPGFQQDPKNFVARQNLERDLVQARADRAALEEEARRKGVRPGWLR